MLSISHVRKGPTGTEGCKVEVFNPLTPAQLAAIVSSVLADSADWQRPLEPFQRGQLRSASSIGKHLSAELSGATAELLSFRDTLRTELQRAHADAAALGERSWAEAVERGRLAIETASDPRDVGMAVAALIDAGKAGTGGEAFARFRPRLHAMLRELADAEIDVLSASADTFRGA